LIVEGYGYRWYRVGGLDYLLRRSEVDYKKRTHCRCQKVGNGNDQSTTTVFWPLRKRRSNSNKPSVPGQLRGCRSGLDQVAWSSALAARSCENFAAKSSRLSLMPRFRAASTNRSNCAGSVLFRRLFGFASAFAIRPLSCKAFGKDSRRLRRPHSAS
jgi:hypothetical protein